MDESKQDAIAEEAGFWDARLRAPDCTESDRNAFTAWRDADPAHRDEFARLQTIVAALRAEMDRADVRSIRSAALAMMERRRRRWGFASAAGVVCLGLGALLWSRITAFENYSTGAGQRSTVTLRDGSSVELNSNTKVEVAFDDERRAVTLREGQALFNVAKAADRPFVVRAGDREIIALGTAFDVRLEDAAVRVTLLQGKVAIKRAGVVQEAVVLAPGEQFVSSAPERERAIVRAIDVAKATSWRGGRVFLEDLSLPDAVSEMNKHSVVQISIGDPSLNRLRVNGMFRAGEQQAFVAALEEYFPLVAERRRDTEIVLKAAAR
jgi:transmembrane sensor